MDQYEASEKSNHALLALCVVTFAMPLFIKGAFLGGSALSPSMLNIANVSTFIVSMILIISTMVAIMYRQNDSKAKDKLLDNKTAYASLLVTLMAPALMFWIFYSQAHLVVYLVAAILIGNGFHALICYDRPRFLTAYALITSFACFLASQLIDIVPLIHTSTISPSVALITGVVVIVINAILVGRTVLKERRHGKR